MTDDNNQNTDQRRGRINRIKKIILISALVLIIVPIILCIILSAKVCSLENQLDELLALKNEGKLIKEVDSYGKVHLKIDDGKVTTADGNIQQESATENTRTEEQQADYSEEETTAVMETEAQTEATKKNGKTVCLTFDDGPSENTEKIIEILDRYGVKATFFVIGKEDKESLERYRMIVESGNTIALHSYSHDYSIVYNSIEDFASEVNRIHDLVLEATGVDTKIFRFPGGSANSTVDKMDIHECIEYLNENGYTYYDWNVSSGDASPALQSVEQIMDNIENDLFKMNTAIILMHDANNKTTTVEALPVLIEMLLEEGFEIKAIDNSVPTIQQIKTEIYGG
ncbi:MAG: polysaccharide deacetylase [Lachnospiraceae bacterium]|nr:polysaccharide deacetylase [Lachnospiraceae bacterium]